MIVLHSVRVMTATLRRSSPKAVSSGRCPEHHGTEQLPRNSKGRFYLPPHPFCNGHCSVPSAPPVPLLERRTLDQIRGPLRSFCPRCKANTPVPVHLPPCFSSSLFFPVLNVHSGCCCGVVVKRMQCMAHLVTLLPWQYCPGWCWLLSMYSLSQGGGVWEPGHRKSRISDDAFIMPITHFYCNLGHDG